MSAQPRSINAITLLTSEHKTVRGLLARLDKTTERASDSREELLDRIGQEIAIHTTIEEEIFYPAYKAAASRREDSKLFHEATASHDAADRVLAELKSARSDSEEFSGRAKLLKDMIDHHAGEEEKEMFPRARQLMETYELQELGRRMAERRKELEADAEGWLPKAGKVLAAVTSRVTASRAKSKPRSASVAARGAAQAKRAAKAAKSTKTRARARSKKTAKRSRS